MNANLEAVEQKKLKQDQAFTQQGDDPESQLNGLITAQ